MSDDTRLLPAACAAWAAMWVATSGIAALQVAGTVTGGVLAVVALRRRSWGVGAVALVILACLGAGCWRAAAVAPGPVVAAASDRAVAAVTLRVDADPRTSTGRFGELVVVSGTLLRLDARGPAQAVCVPVVVMATGERAAAWRELRVGAVVEATARLAPPDPGQREGAVLSARSEPQQVRGPPPWLAAVNGVRAGLARATSGLSGPASGLLPALVVGDTSRLPDDIAADFRTTGLTHLCAVSGSNLVLLVAFLQVCARWAGVRGLALRWLAAGAAVSFVVLCRGEPSVVRAAAMGAVALAALSSSASDRRGLRTLAVAVWLLLLWDPWLSRSWGFALSAAACLGIIALASRWRDGMTWCPRWVAEAVAVPLSAQLVTQPLVTALAGQVSVVAVLANAVAGPLVGPATVLGILVTLMAVVWPWGAALLARLAAVPADGIVLVARWGARLPGASLAWPATPVGLVLVTLACLLATVLLGELLRRRVLTLALTLAVAASLLVTPRVPGWPPPGWAVVSCDVGQGDATVVAVAPHTAIVVDTGPDAALLETCLRRLGIDRVPLLVLTHDHADHVGGIAAAVARRPSLTLLSATPSANRPALLRALAAAGARTAVEGEELALGTVRLTVLAAPVLATSSGAGDSPEENDGGIVLRVTTPAGSVLLTGDLEPGGQDRLLARGVDVTCDALKVPHHGSGRQSPAFLRATRARVALISVGARNEYGHPARRTLDALAAAGMTILRTDERGSLGVAADPSLRLVVERGS